MPRQAKRVPYHLTLTSVRDVSVFVGRSQETINLWIKENRLPRRSDQNGKRKYIYDAFECARTFFAVEHEHETAKLQTRVRELEAEVEKLKQRRAAAKPLEEARIRRLEIQAERDLIELAVRRKELLPLKTFDELMIGFTTKLRKAGEHLGRRFGADAQILLNEVIDSYIRERFETIEEPPATEESRRGT